MPQGRSIVLTLLAALVLTAVFTVPFSQPVQAQVRDRPPYEASDNCVKCHENLYLLHDTGNWYCLMEAPMTCTECHGGDPGALTQEEAHLGRAAHPVVNEDISKCQECHPEECDERMDMFDQVAGISEIKVAARFTPAFRSEIAGQVEETIQQEPVPWIDLWELLPVVLVAGAALLVYAVYRYRHRRP